MICCFQNNEENLDKNNVSSVFYEFQEFQRKTMVHTNEIAAQ